MPLIYVTGIAGSGKSAAQKELQRRGYEAHDVDEPGIGAAYNLQTGEIVSIPDAAERSPEWFEAHTWKMDLEAVKELKARSLHGVIYLCGRAGNESEAWRLFDKVVYLDINDDTLRWRLAVREDNDFGKTEHELQQILKRNKRAREEFEPLGAVFIDASESLDKVVGEIVKQSQ